MSEVMQGNLGNVGKYDVKLEDGQFVVEADAVKGHSSVGLVLKIDGRDVLEAIKAKYPGIPADVAGFLENALFPAKAPEAAPTT